MEKFIELTMADKTKVYLNVKHIGHLFVTEQRSYIESIANIIVTKVGITTHNNGGFSVLESPQEILNLIKS